MVRKRKKIQGVPTIEGLGPDTIFLDDVVNGDWPKQTDDTHEAIQARIDAELAEERAARDAAK